MKGNKKQLTDKEIEEIIEKKYSKKLPHTKDYIREQLKKDPNYKCKFSMVKQDFIDEYYRSREGKLCPSFDFTDVPEFIKSTHEYVILICLDKDSKGNQIGEYKTCYKQLVNNGNNPVNYNRPERSSRRFTTDKFIEDAVKIHEDKYDYSEVNYINNKTKVKIFCKTCNEYFYQTPRDHIHSKAGCPRCGNKLNAEKRSLGKEEFVKRAENKWGGKYDYSKVEYVNSTTKVKIFCKECNKYFYQTPYWHLNSKFGCPDCANKKKINNKYTTEEFIEKAVKIHGNLYDYSKVEYINSSTPVLITDTETGDEFYQVPRDHLGGNGNPNRHDSFGERIIKTWLKNNISKNCWDREKRFTNIQGRNIDWGVVIDFVININGKTYWIEYNGEQHYELRLGSIIYKHYTEEEALEVFQKQLVRDKNVRKYCKENNIILVEIPYSYNTYKKISVLLFNILIENKDPEDIINIPKIKYRKED